MSLNKLAKKLDSFKTGEHYDRRNYCYLVHNHKGVDHTFQVRHWKFNKSKYSISISAVNWTLTAGPCTIKLTGKNYDKFIIKEIE